MSRVTCFGVRGVLLDSDESFESLSLMTVRALSTHTLLNSAITSFDTKISSSSTVLSLRSVVQCLEFFTWCFDLPTSRDRTLVNYLAVLYMIEPPNTMGRKGKCYHCLRGCEQSRNYYNE